jgi:3-isopropylmalate/(R)-2-methylmalate dehydratase small subunit
LLPVTLPPEEVAELRRQLHEKPGSAISVDLEAQTVTGPAGRVYRFEVHPVRKKCLLQGLDDIARTQQYDGKLAAFESAYKTERPWLYGIPRAS